MADVWVVLVYKGSGQLGGVFNTFAAAQAYVTGDQVCNYEIMRETVDGSIGTTLAAHTNNGPPLRINTSRFKR